MNLSLKVLGGFAVHDAAGADVPLPTRKARALLGYLAVNTNRAQPREKLTSLLWSRQGTQQARHSLNQSLVAIRKLGLGSSAPLVETSGDYVALVNGAIDIDVVRFRALINENPTKAADLYSGPLLDGLSCPDPGFEEWLIPARAALHEQACLALEKAVTAAAQQGRNGAALECAKRLVSLDPLREDAHRLLMRQLRDSGDRAGALRQFRACTDILKRELQVEPEPATRALFEKIKGNAGSRTESRPRPPTHDAQAVMDKPSIAVLPFDDLGCDEQHSNLADGLAEDLITALSKLHQLFVVPRQFTTPYRARVATVQQAAIELGVRYALTGSVRTAGTKLRCSVQLIDTARGHQVWAERYDESIDDVFAISDEIVRHTLIELQVHLTAGESARVISRGTKNLEAWLLFIQGYSEGMQWTRDGFARARELLQAAHEADPNWARPLAAIGWTHLHFAENGWSASREESIKLGIALTEQAIAMDPEEPLGYQARGRLHLLLGEHEAGLVLSEKAVSVAPNDHFAVAGLAIRYLWLKQFNRALELFERAKRISPLLPEQFRRRHAQTLHLAGRPKEAVQILEELTRVSPKFIHGHVQLAVAYADIGRIDSARACVQTALHLEPGFTISEFLASHNFRDKSVNDWQRELLAKAKLPERKQT